MNPSLKHRPNPSILRRLGPILLAGTLTLQAACLRKAEEEDPSAQDPDILETGVVNDEAGFTIKVGSEVTYPAFIHQEGEAWNTGCTVTEADLGTSAADISCILQAQEGDLYFGGSALHYNVPTDMCSYLYFSPYWYYQYPYGYGDNAFTVTENAAGALTLSNNNGTVTLDATGSPTCIYDHSAEEGPNCCLGKYTLTTIPWDADAGAAGSPEQSTGDWGGTIGDCISGSAKDTQDKSDEGLPLSDIFLVEGVGINEVYTIASPLKKEKLSNLYLANADLTSTIENSMFGSRYYEFACLDRSFEVKARIRVQIQEWNTASEFAKQTTGNPNAGEPTGIEDPPFEDQPLNDRWDWNRFYTALGNDTTPYPEALD